MTASLKFLMHRGAVSVLAGFACSGVSPYALRLAREQRHPDQCPRELFQVLPARYGLCCRAGRFFSETSYAIVALRVNALVLWFWMQALLAALSCCSWL